jgi:hypothetical protein
MEHIYLTKPQTNNSDYVLSNAYSFLGTMTSVLGGERKAYDDGQGNRLIAFKIPESGEGGELFDFTNIPDLEIEHVNSNNINSSKSLDFYVEYFHKGKGFTELIFEE